MKRKLVILTMLLSAITFNAYGTENVDATTEIETMKTEVTEPETTEYIYVICDVTETNEEFFTALMPNGELHEYYMVEDFPIDEEGNPSFELVCFKVATETQDDYSTYETVTVR